MRSYRRTGSRQRGRSDGSFWLSFSDLMSSLVIVFILVMFYIIYQYFDLAELNQAEIARREYQLEETQTALEAQQSKLTDAEKQMIAQQILLDAKQKELTSAQDILESQKAELATTQSQLTDKETEIASQQAQLDALSAQLNAQQAQLTDKESQLSTAQDQLSVQQSQLATAQSQLADQQFQLSEQEAELVLAQRKLSDQEAELLLAQAQLAAHEAELTDAQSKIDSQQAQLNNQQAQIEQLVGMKTRIISSLSNALRESNISATVDPSNGSIALKSDVLFESGQYKLSSQGKRFIDSFLPVYLNVLFSDEYKPYIAEIIVEGHTDSDGGYLSNLELSQQRALAVASYVLGDSCKTVTRSVKMQLRPVMTVNGRSYSDLITNANGKEDKDASRRVVFKFRLTDEQMIQQLRQILENQ